VDIVKTLINNFIFLREKSKLSQAQLSLTLGFSRGVWNMYEKGNSKPSLDDLVKISDYFGYSPADLIGTDLSNVHLNEKIESEKKSKNVHLNVHPNVHLSGKKKEQTHDVKITIVSDTQDKYGSKITTIPITDLSIAAGGGAINESNIDISNSIQLPSILVKPGHSYLCVRIKGESMAPTLQDGGYVIVRLLDRSEWAKMRDERIFGVIDTEGKSYLKRIKNRFKQGFIVLRSDNPDYASYPSFNLEHDEISSIWYAEFYLSAKMPNVHDQYYTRLQQLEDRFDSLSNYIKGINPK